MAVRYDQGVDADDSFIIVLHCTHVFVRLIRESTDVSGGIIWAIERTTQSLVHKIQTSKSSVTDPGIMAAPRAWYRDNYMVSTAPQLIQSEAVNAAFDSEELYWAKRLAPEILKKMLSNSLCFGLYQLPESSSEVAGELLLSTALHVMELTRSQAATILLRLALRVSSLTRFHLHI